MAWVAYQGCLHAHPFKTKALTTACITGLSDVLLQLYEHNSSKKTSLARRHDACADVRPASWLNRIDLPQLNPIRVLTLSAVGLVYSGPLNHFWFAALEKCVRIRHQVGAAVIKLAFDQMMFVPVAISGYMITRGIFEQKSLPQIHTQLEEKLWLAATQAWQFWPVVNMISFSIIPVIYRVLFGNLCAVFWNAKLSAISFPQDLQDCTQGPSIARGDSFDETLPSCGFDEAWALGSASNLQEIYNTGEEETFPTSGFDETWALGQTPPSPQRHSSCIFRTGFDESLPTCGFDEAWALDSADSPRNNGGNGNQMVPRALFDESFAMVE